MGVVRPEVASKPLLGGRQFGDVGAYEEFSGEALFAVDPLHPLTSVPSSSRG